MNMAAGEQEMQLLMERLRSFTAELTLTKMELKALGIPTYNISRTNEILKRIAREHPADCAIIAKELNTLWGVQHSIAKAFDHACKFAELVPEIYNLAAQLSRSREASANARKGLANDPKQAAKGVAKELWRDWQSGKTRHKSGAAFARHVVATSPIESEKTVQRWMKQWATENRD